MSDLPRPTLEQSISALQHRDEYKTILAFIESERNQRFADMSPAMTPYEVMSYKGEIAALDGVLLTLSGDWINERSEG